MARPAVHAERGAQHEQLADLRPHPDHLVSFYEDATYLAASVRPFLLAGLDAGETVLVVASEEHREAFARALVGSGHDLAASRRAGRYRELDAAKVLARIAPGGVLTSASFRAGIADAVTALARSGAGFRAYGELSALLWQRGDLGLALELEDRSNALLSAVAVPIFCGYPLTAFDTAETTARFHDVCARHTLVTTNSYGTIGGRSDGVVMLPAGQPGGSPD